jgi:ABC-type branched-subunit amino acid transport system substrate-binding protein
VPQALPDYDVLVIRLTPGRGNAYNVEIASAAGSRGHGQFTAPAELDIEEFRNTMDPRARRLRGRSRNLEAATQFGARLFEALLSGPAVREVYVVARRDAHAAGRGLRVTLSLGAVPELASVPWEFLYDRPRFLAQHVHSPVVRFVDLEDPPPPLRVEAPLRVLGIVSRPKDDDLANLNAEEEQAALERCLRPLIDSGRVTLRWLTRATLEALQQEVDRGEGFHVFHYIGHGEYDEERGHGSLILERDDRRARRVDGQQLGTMLSRLCDNGSLRLVVLNACEAAQTAPQDPLAGVATSLMEFGVPAVVAMQFAITDDGALTFADEFYGALAAGYDVDAAVTQARRALAAHSDVEWGTPVLFMRVADGRLFDLGDSTPPAPRKKWLASLLAIVQSRGLARRPGSGRPLRRGALRIAIGAAVAALVVAIIVLWPEDRSVTIYSSLPETSHPTSDAADATGPANERSLDMENAMRLALRQADGKAGGLHVTYEPLDDSDSSGATPTALVRENANRAARDPDTAVYIGDYNSGATQDAMPILNDANIPQISPAATRVGLTTRDPIGDTDEPKRYRPSGRPTFVRIIPTAAIIAKALLTRMAEDGCRRTAMIDDDSPYGTDLANNLLYYRRTYASAVTFVFSQSVGAYGRYDYLQEKVRGQKQKPNCFVYSGTRNTNTVQIFRDFAKDLGPTAELYGTNGVADKDFYRGMQQIAGQVTVMLPWYDEKLSAKFKQDFHDAYDRYPDPYAFYAYEAMKLALDAVRRSKTGKPKDIVTALLNEKRRDTPLGNYSFTDQGDIDPSTAGMTQIAKGRLAAPDAAPCQGC